MAEFSQTTTFYRTINYMKNNYEEDYPSESLLLPNKNKIFYFGRVVTQCSQKAHTTKIGYSMKWTGKILPYFHILHLVADHILELSLQVPSTTIFLHTI